MIRLPKFATSFRSSQFDLVLRYSKIVNFVTSSKLTNELRNAFGKRFVKRTITVQRMHSWVLCNYMHEFTNKEVEP